MLKTTTPGLNFTYLSELIEQLGDIPPARILLKPPPGLATEKDLLDLPLRRPMAAELVDGVLVEKAMGAGESSLAGWILLNFGPYFLQHDPGCMLTEAGLVRLRAGLVRAPDLTFVRWDKLPNGEMPTDSILDLAPDLAVEILSKSNTPAEIRRKIGEYFDAGTEAVWIIDPVRRTVAVYIDADTSTTLTEADTLDGGSVLPGLDFPIRRIFERLPTMKKTPRRKKP